MLVLWEQRNAFLWGYGGIGIRGGLKNLCREACGFESHYPHHYSSAWNDANILGKQD